MDTQTKIAKLEVKVDLLQQQSEELLDRIDDIQRDLTKYRGFLGGIAFVFSGIGLIIAFGKDFLIHHFLQR